MSWFPVPTAAFLLTTVASVALFGLTPASLVHADPVLVSPDRPVLVNAMVVYASQKEGTIDPLCRQLQQKLRLMDFKTLRLVKQQIFKLRMGERGVMPMPTGHALDFLPISVIDKELHMQVEMPGMVNTRMRMVSGKGVVLGGVKYEDGYLIVRLQPIFRVPRVPSEAAAKKREELTRVRNLHRDATAQK